MVHTAAASRADREIDPLGGVEINAWRAVDGNQDQAAQFVRQQRTHGPRQVRDNRLAEGLVGNEPLAVDQQHGEPAVDVGVSPWPPATTELCAHRSADRDDVAGSRSIDASMHQPGREHAQHFEPHPRLLEHRPGHLACGHGSNDLVGRRGRRQH